MMDQGGPRVTSGPFRAYDTSIEEVRKGTEVFLQSVGYEFLNPGFIGLVRPDFHVRRQEGDKKYEIVFVLAAGIDQSLDAFIKLAAMKATRGESLEYGVVLPPINEYLLLEWLMEDKGKNFYELKKQEFMLLMYNPAEEAMWSWIGRPKDPTFSQHFVLPGFSPDVIIGQRLAWVLEEEEEEDL